MGNVNMEARQIHYRGGNKPMSVEEAIKEAESSYVLPAASAETLGGVKVGEGLSINESGVLSAGGGLPNYSTTEHLTGQKWIDGKDIYEITYPLIVGGVAQYTRGGMENKSYLVGLTGFDIAYISEFIGVRSTAIDSFPIANTMYYTFDKANGAIFVAHDTFTYSDLYVTVRYTKSE